MSGKHITQAQRTLYMKSRQSGLTQDTSAAKAGISPRSGRRIEKNSQAVKKQRHWKTRKDPFSGIWEADLMPLLEKELTLTGLTLWEYLDENYPQSYPYYLLRSIRGQSKIQFKSRTPGS